MRESVFEQALRKKIKALGGISYKWVSPGQDGVPDRICVFPGGAVVFMEVKRPGVKDGRSAQQKKVQAVLEKMGCCVFRVGDKGDFEKMMEAVNAKNL